ncbi:hypothetical protein LCGC14_0717620 [marine sediment metagenome]|uniref:Glycosyltransferase n=1 Tax=marine sediment metagenome TaxID=412755 RepID=A0A0F9QYF0_9ZZZZ
MLKVLCVLKSSSAQGQGFGPMYVHKLRDAVKRHLKMPHEFICLTDLPADRFDCKTEPLTDDLKGWWSKIELFKYKGPCLYFDLDTVLTGSVKGIAEAVCGKGDEDGVRKARLYMLTPSRATERWASGVMAWRGDLSKIHSFFARKDMDRFRWDQRYVSFAADKLRIEIVAVQKYTEVHSYKWHCKEKLPKGAQIICFHGRPRPHEVKDSWVQEHWR